MHTALVIKSNEVKCDAGGPAKNCGENDGKYVGWIMLDVGRWHPLLNTEPIYPTAAAAKKAMEDLVEAIRKADLSKEIDSLCERFLND